MAQADTVARMAARANSAAERQVYDNIAEGWRKLAAEARRNERRDDHPGWDDAGDDEALRRVG